ILDKLEHPAWQRDASLNLTYCNLAHSKILEEHAEEAITADAMELFGGARDLAKNAIESNEPQIIRKPIVINGKRHLFEITEMPAKGGTVGYAMDISTAEETEQKLSQHIAVQNDLMESTASAIAIYGADMHLQFYNRAFMLLWKLDK